MDGGVDPLFIVWCRVLKPVYFDIVYFTNIVYIFSSIDDFYSFKANCPFPIGLN
jgi:hypothetical protein